MLQTELATRVERKVSAFVLTRVSELRLFERTSNLVASGPSATQATLGRLLAHDQVYHSVAVVLKDGTIRAFASRTGAAPQEPDLLRHSPFAAEQFWEQNAWFIGPVLYDHELREPLLDVAVPLTDRRIGTVAKVLVVRVRFRQIWDLLADARLPSESIAFVTDARGQVLAHPSPAVVLSETVLSLPVGQGRHPLPDGRPGLYAWQPLLLGGKTARVVVTRPLDTALASATEMVWITFAASAALLVASGTVALFLSRQIAKPIEILSATARKISEQNTNPEIEVSGPEETRNLALALKDMNDRLQSAIDRLRRSEYTERQRALVTLQSIGDAVITTDREGLVVFANAVAEELTGWTTDAACGRRLEHVFRILDGTTREPSPNPVSCCLASGSVVELGNNTILINRDGSELQISDSAAPIREQDGTIVGVVLVFRDVTERKKMEAALRLKQRHESIGQLAGGVAHDFNNLLQVIQGNMELICDEPNVDQGLTGPILRAARRGAELSSQLLSYGQRQTLIPRPFDPARLIADILPLLSRTIGEQYSVSLQAEPECWPAFADPGQFEDGLLNLVLNARDAMPKGGEIAIYVYNARRENFATPPLDDVDEREFVGVCLADNGSGMSEETRRHSVEPFFTTKGVGKGSGLGLSMVYGFVMQSKGHFEIESAPDKGTVVRIYLPRAHSTDRTVPHPPTTGDIASLARTVLLIENDPDVRAQTERSLRSLNCKVLTAGTVAEARHLLEAADHVDIVLSDVVLPERESGVDFARELRTTRPDLAVMLMSGHPKELMQVREDAELDLVPLKKPFRREELAAALRAGIERKTARH